MRVPLEIPMLPTNLPGAGKLRGDGRAQDDTARPLK
jgi:hypothetical protein